jgi:superfamily II DNA/RNA helicase
MISTEVASRGLDFPDLNHIILFDVPPSLADYGNRVGRSARFNSSGVSLLMLHYQESDYAEKIRFYCPQLEVLEKDIILDGFSSYLSRINIRDNSLHYIEGLVRSLVKDDEEKYALAKKAYVSMLRAYPFHYLAMPDSKISISLL